MQSSSIPDHAAGVAVGHGVPPVSESQPQQGVHSIPISLPFSHWLPMYEAYQINSTAILDALKSDVATHLRIEREAPWIQALTIAFVPFEPPHAQLCIPPGSMDAMVLNDVQLAALRPVAPKRTIGVLNEMLPQNSSNVAGPRHSNPNDERLHHATSSPRKRSYTASSHVDAYAPPSFLTNANAHRIRGLTSGKLRTHSIGESAASHHLGSTTSPRVKSARGKPRYGVMSTPASPNAARAPRHHVYPHDAASYANSAGYESMPTPGISSTTSPMNPQQTEQQKRARLPDSLQFLADGNLFDRLQGEQWMKRFASTTTNEDSVDVTSHVGGPASSQTSGLIVHLERKEHHPSAQSQHNHSERTGSPLRVPGHPDASTPVLLIGHALDTSRLSLIHNMGQSRRRLVAEHLRNDIIEHFRGDVPLWPQDIELKIDQSGVYLALFGLPSSLIAGNGSYDTVLQTLQYKAYLPVRLVNLTAMLDRQGATHSGTRDSSTTLTSFVYPPGSEPAESITAGLDRPRPCVIERPAVQGSAWLDETTTTLPNQKELTIPVSIQLPGKYMQALNLLDRRQLDLLCIEAECDVRTHLELVQLDELLSSQKSVTVDPSVNLNALDATICIGSHATPEKYYAIRARLGENILITRTDAMLERILQTGEGRSPNTAEGTDASQVDNSTIALTMRLSETHAVQLRLLQPPTIGMLREEARHDIHECLSRAGLGDAIPIHMIHVTPSMDIGAFDVDVHIPKSVRQTRFGQIQKVLSSEVAIPRTGTLLEQILRQQPQALRSPQRRSASRSNSVPRTRTTMIIPVTMRMTSMHSRALRGINSSQIAQLQAFTREDVHAHLTAHGLSNVIKHEHITVQPAPHLNALNVDVKLVAGTPESIHRRLREALAEAISIPRAGEHLGELLREKRQETLALQKENTGSFRSNRVVTTASRTALPSDDADQDPSVQVRSARHSSRPGRTRSIEPSKFRKQQLQQQQQQQQQQQVPPRKAPVPVFRQSPRKSYVSERKKSPREMPVRKSQSRAEKPRRKESVPAAAPSKEVVTHGSGKKMVKETPPRDLTPPQNRTPEETIPVPRAAPTTAPVQAISSRKSTPHETTFAPEPHPLPTLVQPPIEEINSTTQTLESRPARPVETQMPTVAENNALVMTDIKDFLKPNNTQVTVQPSTLSQHSVQSTIASSVTSFVALDSFEAPISVVSRTSSYTPEFKPVLGSATSTVNSTNFVSRTMDSTFNQPTTGTINNSPRDYIPETNSLSRTSSTRTTMTQNLTDATTLEHQRKVDELLRNVSSSNFSHSNSINASGSFGAVNNEMVTSSMKLESSDVERYKQLLILNRDEIKKAIRCDVLVHVRGLPINLQAEDVIVADMESPFNIVVEVPIRSAITRRSKEQLRERMLQPITAIEVRKLLERI